MYRYHLFAGGVVEEEVGRESVLQRMAALHAYKAVPIHTDYRGRKYEQSPVYAGDPNQLPIHFGGEQP